MLKNLIPLKFRIPLLIGYAVLVAVFPAVAENKVVQVVKPLITEQHVVNEAGYSVPTNEVYYVDYSNCSGRLYGPIFPLWRPNDCFWERGPLRRLVSRPWRR